MRLQIKFLSLATKISKGVLTPSAQSEVLTTAIPEGVLNSAGSPCTPVFAVPDTPGEPANVDTAAVDTVIARMT